MRIFHSAAVLLACLAFSNAAQAHHIWLEQSDKGLQLYFGEFGSNLRETSPGLLDKIDAHVTAADKPLTTEKSANAFAISGPIGAKDSVIAEDTRYPIAERKTGTETTRSIYRPAARFLPDRAVREATLELDIVPTGADTFKVVFKGKPLSDAKVALTSKSGWSRDVHTAADGVLNVALPWRGTYVLEVLHADRTPGKRGDEAYDLINYVTSVTFSQKNGPEAPTAPAPAKPN